jgi:aminopeptidase N
MLTPEQREAIFGDFKREPIPRRPMTLQQEEALANQDGFDVTHYLVDLDFDEQTRTIDGSVTMTATSLVDGLQNAVLDLAVRLTVTSVDRGAVPLAFTHANGLLDIALDRPFDSGQSFQIRIAYGGAPSPGNLDALNWNRYQTSGEGEAIWSWSEPEGARRWWPCKDRPDDKAIVLEHWTVRPDWTATGNGLLLGVDTLADGRNRFRWQSSHPMATYLVSIVATDFVSFSDLYTPIVGDPMPIDYYVYPEDLADAQVSFSRVESMMGFLAGTFGEYPYLDEKYGMSSFPAYAMEHATNTSYGYFLIDGTHQYDPVILHELAHSWFGNSVGPQTWKDIWLNEGFATYAEALWAENSGGASAYQDYMNSLHGLYFSGSLYDPDHLFGNTVYGKGAWVQHMLRRQLGDQVFFESQRDWVASNLDGVVDTAQYQAHIEAHHGASLDWFFQQWLHRDGEPAYEYGYGTASLSDGTYRTYLQIRQTTPDGSVYTMPIDIELIKTVGREFVTVWNDAAVQDLTFDTTVPITEIRFDPRNWLLKTYANLVLMGDRDFDGVPDSIDNCTVNLNPDQANLDGDAYGDVCDDDDDGDDLVDGLDCAPLDATQGRPGEARDLEFDTSPTPVLSWIPALRADWHDVTRGPLGSLDAGLGVCLATGLAGAAYVDSEVLAPGEGFGYLVRGHDDGCGGAGSLGSASTGQRESPCP